MPVFSMDRTRWRGLGLIFVLFLAACGGGGSGGSGSTPPPVTAPADLSYSSPTVGTVGVTLATLSPSVKGSVTSYSVSPALPAGLSLDTTTGQISGTPAAESPATSYVITAANTAGSTTFTLSLTVLAAAPTGAPTGLSYPSPVVATLDVALPTLSPSVKGTVSSYSVSPALPAGLSLDKTSGQITGTPVAESPAASYVITASNAAGSTTFMLSLAVLVAAPAALQYPSPQTYTAGTPVTLNPSVTGLVTRYAVAPALPAGLVLNAVTGQINGTPTTPTAAANYLITASNGTGSTTFSLSLTILIPAPTALSYPNPQTYIAGTAIAALTPQVTGTVTRYSVMPALPAGLSLNVTTGQITGTPSTPTPMATYLITASNSTGSTSFLLTIAVLIPAPSALSYPSPQIYTVGSAIAPLNPTVTGSVTGYSVLPALPAGLLLNPTSGQITGTPTAPALAGIYTIAAANGTGHATFGLSITVRIAPPSGLSYRTPQTYTVGMAIIPLAPTVAGTVASYGVSPALPAGLTLNPTSGIISGTPTAASSAASYTITASNSTGSTTFSLALTVVLLPPQSLSYPSPQSLALNTPMTPLVPFVVGIVMSYSVTPALPAGLALDPSSGQITGTPTVLSAAATYTVKASNSAGSATFGLSISVVIAGTTPSHVSRLVAQGTPVVVQLALASQALTNPLYVMASDPSGLFNSAVSVTTTANGWNLVIGVSTAIAPGHYTGNLALALCHDAVCAVPQSPGSVTLPFDVYVLSSTSAWSGNNLTPLAAWSGVADWTMFQGNAAHTGYVAAALDPNNFATRWQGPTLDNTSGYSSFAYTLTTDNDQLYLAYSDTLYALKELDGSQTWKYSMAGLQFPSVNPPAEANGTVYMAAGQQSSTYFWAFSETDGSLVFKSPMQSQWENYLAPTIGAVGVYTNAGEYGGLYGFDFSGNSLFVEGLAQESQWTPAVDSSYVYSYTGELTVANAQTGAVQATITDPTFQNYTYAIGGSAVLGAPGSVFAAAYMNAYINGGGIGNSLLDFDVTGQSVAWSVAGDYAFTPAYHAGVVYAVNNKPLQLEARSETDGSLLWSWTPPQAGDTSFASEVLLTQSMIFVATNLATYGIDVQTHRLVFSYPLPGRLALSHNGILYIQGVGPLTAINVK
jgi:hypothetical protein